MFMYYILTTKRERLFDSGSLYLETWFKYVDKRP